MNYKRIEIAPSILSADFSVLSNVADEVEASGARYLHLDVMDGQFVPQITFGPKLVSDLRSRSGLIFDAHLMIMNPENQIEAFAQAGCDYITIHQESCIHVNRALNMIREHGIKCGISICPGTSVSAIESVLDICDLVLVMTVNPGFGGQKMIQSCLDKVVKLCELREAEDYSYLISVDGGVNLETVQDVVAAGADIAVTGSAFFNEPDKLSFMEKMHSLALESFH